uniref:Reverse transcriptase domain-containing protein n=1 Tax=Panagrolaimus superbus TaxID=310955 RepID=A0A914Z9R0_9BILA
MFRFILSYRPKEIKAIDAFEDFTNLFNSISPFQPTAYILLGDLNLPEIKWDNYKPPSIPAKNMKRINNKIIEFCENHQMKQLVDFPTRITKKTKNILDLVFSSTTNVKNVSTVSQYVQKILFSTLDHEIVSFEIEFQSSIKEIKSSSYLDFANGNYDLFNYYISTIPWKEKLSSLSNSTKKFNFIKSIILKGIYDMKLIPQKNYNSFEKNICYPKIISKMKQTYLNLMNDPFKTDASRKVGKKLFKMFKNFVDKNQKKLLSNQKTLYKTLASITKTPHAPIPTLIIDETPIFENDEKAEAMKNYFKSVYNQSNRTISYTSNEPQADSLCNIIFNRVIVEKYLKSCKSKNLLGPDGLPGYVIKELRSTISLPFTILFNHMIQNCDIPDVFLISHVTPIPKIPNSIALSDYRPISGTSDILKTLERYVKENLMMHLKMNKFLPEEQFGFRPGHSTTKQMILFEEHINRATQKKITTDVIYIDVQKAFDKPKFEDIQKELKEAKIDGKLLNLIMHILVHRVFLVKVNGKCSSQTTADSGVGQAEQIVK